MRLQRQRDRAPGPRGVPWLGSTLAVFRDPYEFFVQTWREHGDIAQIRMGPYRYFLITDADAIRHVLVDNAKNYVKSVTYRAFRPVLGDGLLTSEGDFWRRQRRLAQPAFHRERLANFVRLMVGDTERMLGEWDEASGPLDIQREMKRLTFRIVGRTLCSVELDEESDAVGRALVDAMAYVHHRATSMAPGPTWLPTPRNLRFRRSREVLDAMVDRIIEERRRGPVEGTQDDLLSMLMAATDADTAERMTNRQLRDEVMTIVLAGHETIATALTWTFYLLSKHPDVERQVQGELREVLGDRPPTAADLPRLPRIARVLNESMRLYPPVWKFERQAIAADRLGGFDVPAGSIVGVTPPTLHRNPKYWDNPEGFDPDRFAPEASERRPRFAYLPFAAGARQCIGNTFALMEAQVVLATVLQRYRLELAPAPPIELEAAVTLRPRHGMPMRLSRRPSAR